MRREDRLGFLVVDADDGVRFASGIGARPEIQRAILARLPGADPSARPLEALVVGERRFVVLTRATPDATLFVVHESGAGEPLLDFVASVDFAFAILNHFLTNPFEAMTVVDAAARVRFISPIHERFFGIAPGSAIGRLVTDVIENTRLHHVVRTGKAEIGHAQEMRGVTRIVSRVPILEGDEIVGAIGQVMFKGPEQLHELSRELTQLRSQVAFYERELSGLRSRTHGIEQIIGSSEAVRQLKADIIKVAPLDIPVLLVGESGTGKELAAHALHRLSPRHEQRMVLVNAAALPASLVESELFGYEPGAFTGAERKGRRGKFEQADKGTLFLDEIGDMPLETQAKLLRVLQDGSFERVGGDKPRRSDFRLITATNRDLEAMIEENAFRLDLYYRLSGVVLRMPPLRERLDDIPELVASFLEAYAARHGSRIHRVHPTVYAYLRERPWPGNVRQLLHEVEKAAIFAEGGEITVADFRGLDRGAPPTPVAPLTQGGIRDATAALERSLVRQAMEKHRGNKKRAAEELGISRSYLYKVLNDD